MLVQHFFDLVRESTDLSPRWAPLCQCSCVGDTESGMVLLLSMEGNERKPCSQFPQQAPRASVTPQLTEVGEARGRLAAWFLSSKATVLTSASLVVMVRFMCQLDWVTGCPESQ